VVNGAALAGTAVGALAVLAIAGITWNVRVELPPPPLSTSAVVDAAGRIPVATAFRPAHIGGSAAAATAARAPLKRERA
jgi:hypothetical protein